MGTLIEIILFVALLWWTAASIRGHSDSAQQASARLAAIVESSDDAVVSKSLEGVIQSWNAGRRAHFRLLGQGSGREAYFADYSRRSLG